MKTLPMKPIDSKFDSKRFIARAGLTTARRRMGYERPSDAMQRATIVNATK
jgi:hypothetical protein